LAIICEHSIHHCAFKRQQAAHAKGGKEKSHFQKETHFHKESHSPKRFRKYHKGQRRKKDFSSYQCYHFDNMGNIAKNCPAKREEYKMRNNKRHHAHATEHDDPPKKLSKEEIEEYVLFSTLSGSMTPGKDTWLIDSGRKTLRKENQETQVRQWRRVHFK
jgi:hypothetical protein